jgi:hypothetical protein
MPNCKSATKTTVIVNTPLGKEPVTAPLYPRALVRAGIGPHNRFKRSASAKCQSNMEDHSHNGLRIANAANVSQPTWHSDRNLALAKRTSISNTNLLAVCNSSIAVKRARVVGLLKQSLFSRKDAKICFMLSLRAKRGNDLILL